MKIKSLSKILLSLFLLLTTLSVATSVEAEELRLDYELYPQVQNITYKNKTNDIKSITSYVLSEGVDGATVNHLLKTIDTLTTKEGLNPSKKQVLVALQGSNDDLEKHVTKTLGLSENIFTEHDAYYLNTESDLVIYAKDSDAAFHAITTLSHMLRQSPNKVLESVEIKDFSKTALRGFIEGFYGVPWSNDDRKELMKFGGDMKMNAYLFAPKDDQYHNEKWRVPYPEDKIAEIEDMVRVGDETKNRFIWTIHPFMNNAVRFDGANYTNDLEIITTKFNQLYDAGVRQFGILADDVDMGRLNANNQLKLMNDLHKWNEDKGDNYNLIFVPSVYNNEWVSSHRSYFTTMNQLPKDIHVMWTGDKVMGSVTQSTVDTFQRLMPGIDGNKAREPFFWLNWPVNDNNQVRLTIGKSETLDAGVKNLDGVVTNPMQQAEASKGALFTIADYAWNTDAFDLDQNFEDSFKYIEETAYESLHTIAQHLNDQAPNIQNIVYEESENLKVPFENYLSALRDDSVTIPMTDDLIAEFNAIAEASQNLLDNASNRRYVDEIKPWIESLRDLSKANIAYLEAQKSFMNQDGESFSSFIAEGDRLKELSKTYRVRNLAGMQVVESGSKRIVPFMESLHEFLSPPSVNFEVSNNFVKIEEAITLENLSSLDGKDIRWEFPGATILDPSTSKPVISYAKEGRYPITMIGESSKGEAKVLKEDYVTVSKIAENPISNIARNKTVSASSTCAPSEGASNAVDGNTRTKWCANSGSNHSLIIDLGQPSLISSIRILHANAGGEPVSLNTKEFSLQISDTNSNFQKIVDVKDNSDSITKHNFPATHARYVKLDITRPTQGADSAGRIFEVEVNGYAGEFTLPPTFTESTVDTQALESVISDVKSLEENDFTPSTWSKLKTALISAEEILKDLGTDQDSIDQAVVNLNAAMAGLIKRADTSLLQETINTSENLESSDYSKTSWSNLVSELDKSNLVLNDSDVSQIEVDDQNSSLKLILDELVLIKGLKTKIDAVQDVSKDNYTEETYKVFAQALEKAKEGLLNPDITTDQVNKLVEDLDDSFNKLEEKEEITLDFTELENHIQAFNKLKKEDYTSSSYNSLKALIDEAEAMLETEVEQKDIDHLDRLLTQAFKDLKVLPSLDAIHDLLAEYETLEESHYTDESWAIFQDTLDQIKEKINKGLETDKAVDGVLLELIKAKEVLEIKIEEIPVDTHKLELLLEKAKKEDKDKYTSSSFKAFQDAITAAEAILAFEDAKQATVDSALDALTKAYNELKLVEKDDEDETLDPKPEKDPVKPSPDEEKEPVASPDKDTTDPLPSTGLGSSFAMSAGFASIALGAILNLKKKED